MTQTKLLAGSSSANSAVVGICMPTFLLGPLLVLVFGIYLEWLPVSGWGDIPGDKLLPSLTLGAAYAAYIARLVTLLRW